MSVLVASLLRTPSEKFEDEKRNAEKLGKFGRERAGKVTLSISSRGARRLAR